jgi:hypothetical protein
MRARTRSVVVGISVAVVLVLSGIVVSQPPPPPTYYGQVAAILEQHCTGCHTAGASRPSRWKTLKLLCAWPLLSNTWSNAGSCPLGLRVRIRLP